MAPVQRPARKDRPREKAAADRADEAAAVQRRLKEEAAQRRQAAAKRQPVSPSKGAAHTRRRTP
jgi:hypothetical protein